MTESKNFLKLSFISSTTSNTLGFTFKIFGSDTLDLTFKTSWSKHSWETISDGLFNLHNFVLK